MKYLRSALLNTLLRLDGQTHKWLSELRRAEHASPSEALKMQRERLATLLNHAHAHTPYYREILQNAGVVRDNGQLRLEKFTNIPCLDKTILRQRLQDITSDDLSGRRWYCNTSGGSTGEPVMFIQDKHYLEWSRALKMLFDSWTGLSLGAPRAMLWGSERDIFQGQDRLRVRFTRWLNNGVWLNSFRMTPDQMRAYVKVINRKRPAQLLAYAQSIYELARFIETEGLQVKPPGAIMTSAETLDPAMRATIQQVFHAPIFNRYGSRETGDMACECANHQGLHVSVLTHYVEVLRPDGTPAAPGETGEIVVTPLNNYSAPLIRYRIGDIAAWAQEPCPCGRGWPLLKEVSGRSTDVFRRQDGTQIHGEFFTHLFYFKPWVKRFQVIQDSYTAVLFLVVPIDSKDDPHRTHSIELEEMTQNARLVLGEDCQVEFRFVEDIPPTASGKHRFIVSRVSH